MNRILIVDDDDLIHATLKTIFKTETVFSAHSKEEANELLQKEVFDVAFLDIQLSKTPNANEGIDILKFIREKDRYLPCVMTSGLEDKDVIMTCLELGAVDYVIKGKSQPDAYKLATYKAAAWKKLSSESISMRTFDVQKQVTEELYQIKGNSQGIKEVRNTISHLSGLPGPFLVMGATGTGKELVARAIWAGKKNKNRPFVAVNCASLPANLIESELFGYERGAFTGALNTKAGLFEAANGGDIFLDEIGELPLEMQSKLLRTLQEKKVRRVGSDRERPVDFRVIAATNVDLLEAVEDGSFREDLFYRLNVHTLRLPALRERAEDIMELLQHFLNLNGLHNVSITADAQGRIASFNWPGNIRQLRAFGDYLVPYLAGPQPTITLEIFERWLEFNVPRKRANNNTVDPTSQIQQALTTKTSLDLVSTVDAFQRSYVEAALKLTNQNRSQAAKVLGVSRQRLSNWLTDWGIF